MLKETGTCPRPITPYTPCIRALCRVLTTSDHEASALAHQTRLYFALDIILCGRFYNVIYRREAQKLMHMNDATL
jgi:hypothetical protein